MSKQKAIALMILSYLLLVLIVTMALVEVERLQERVDIIEMNNLSSVNKNSLKTILEGKFQKWTYGCEQYIGLGDRLATPLYPLDCPHFLATLVCETDSCLCKCLIMND